MTTVTNNLNHSTWECKYHVVFTPKYRKKVLYGMIRRDLKDVFHRLAKQKECVIEEGALMPDHYSAQTQCCEYFGVSERQKLDMDSPEYCQQTAQLCRA